MSKLLPILFVSAALTGASLAKADQLNVSIDGFADPTTFLITSGDDLSLRVAELVPANGTNTSTHILIEGLSPLEDGSSVYASTYAGVDVNSGDEQDYGVLYLDMPPGSDVPAGTVMSPIVGVVQRAGTWADFDPTINDNTLSGSTGTGDYANDSIALQLSNNSGSFSGSAAYSVIDTDTLMLDPFTLTMDGVTSYDMSAATLIRDGSRFYGTLTNLNDSAPYESLLFAVQLTNIPDLDGDGIPDISDDAVEAGLTPGVWQKTALGWVYGFDGNWGYSFSLGFFHMQLPWIYQANHGWMKLVQSMDLGPEGTGFFLYNPDDGFMYGASQLGDRFYQIDTGSWGHFWMQ